jgi:hypothetical protein
MKSIIFGLLTIVAFSDTTQVIKEANIKLDFSEEWFLADKPSNENIQGYIFKRKPITDETGLQVIPNIAVFIETIPPDLDVIVYSANWRIRTPFKVKSMFSHDDPKKDVDFNFENAVGYVSEYNDSKGRPHNTYYIYAINEGKGIQIIFDSTTSVFEIADKEFRRTIKSIQKL